MAFTSKANMIYQDQQLESEMTSWIVRMVDETQLPIDTIRELFDEQFPNNLGFFEDVITDIVYN